MIGEHPALVKSFLVSRSVRSMISVSRRRAWFLLCFILCFIAIAEYRLRYHGGVSLDRISFDAQKQKHAAPKSYSKTLVIGYRPHRDNVSWVDLLPVDITRSIYVIGNKTASPSLPANKGREAMVYLTYIIDHYPVFDDVVMFFHPSDRAWHNNVLLNNRSRETIGKLSSARVLRDGYFNTRCHWDPGCTGTGEGWLHFDVPGPPLPPPNTTDSRTLKKLLGEKPEERYLTSALWRSLHPGTAVPHVLGQAGGAQFAVSGSRITSRPLADYVRWREWLVSTELEDWIAGRIMEYMWQYIFTGRAEVCPSEFECLCDGFGICFEDDGGLNRWYQLRDDLRGVDEEIYYLRYNTSEYVDSVEGTLREKSRNLGAQLQKSKESAFRRGQDPKVQALAAGRSWIPEDADVD